MWYDADNIFAMESLSVTEWLLFAAINVAFLLFMITVAPRLKVFLRAWQRWEDDVYRNVIRYYGAMGGPSVVPRNLAPELSVLIYIYFGAISLWIFVSQVLPTIFFALAGLTFLLWRGSILWRAVTCVRDFRRRRRETGRHEASRYIAEQADN
jgi:hypothetical protein